MKLTSDEIALARTIAFEEQVLSLIKELASSPLVRVVQADEDGGTGPGPGVSVAVKNGEDAEKLIDSIREPLASLGYRPFWSERHEPNGLKETDEVVVLKTKDPYAMMRLRLTDGGNYDITTDDIIERLETWRKLAVFDVVGASRDWVAIQFSQLPKDICKFAEEVYLFCSDSVTQGVGFTNRHNQKKIEAARTLCPDPISPAIRQKWPTGRATSLTQRGIWQVHSVASSRRSMTRSRQGFDCWPTRSGRPNSCFSGGTREWP